MVLRLGSESVEEQRVEEQRPLSYRANRNYAWIIMKITSLLCALYGKDGARIFSRNLSLPRAKSGWKLFINNVPDTDAFY